MIKIPALFAGSFRKPNGLTGIVTGWLMKKYNYFVYPAIEKYADIKEGMKILEIGYGPGVGLSYFLGKYNIEIDGIDFSEQMYKKAGRRNSSYLKKGSLRLYCDDFLDKKMEANQYDLIIFANVIYFWKDINIAFSKIKSLLKENGRLAFYMTGPEFLKRTKLTDNDLFEHYEIETVLASLHNCGFTTAESYKLKDDSGNFNIIKAEL